MRLQQYEYRQAGSSALQARAFLYLSGESKHDTKYLGSCSQMPPMRRWPICYMEILGKFA